MSAKRSNVRWLVVVDQLLTVLIRDRPLLIAPFITINRGLSLIIVAMDGWTKLSA
ncbi:hypothetical protein BMS3Bbin04_01017 [bacterium BMS3Bbin04]|nr:hypothetical protein BMS3Bbin04_01017 [bacterium BMS3Bbin04]